MRTTTFDFSPLFRTAVGFDRLTRMLDSAAQYSDGDLSYPPYNIEQTDDDRYRVTMAVAGFRPTEIEVVLTENTLTIKSNPESEEKSKWRFQLADHIKVENAAMSDGLLTIELAREVPEEKKPRRIPIGSPPLLEDEAA